MTEVLDAEIVSDETTFTPDASHLPATELIGWCQDAKDFPLDREELNRLHTQCPGTIWPTRWPDPARKGTFYTTPGRRCSCVCHTRPVL